MPTFQGQTDQVVKIQLKSYLLLARWLDPEVAANGEAALEVITAYVGDGAKVEATVKDLQGKTLTTVKGTMHSNLFRGRFKVPTGNTTGGMIFEANLPAHGLKLASQAVKVGPPVEFSELKWLDAKEDKTPEEAEENQTIRYQAKVKGLQDGDEVHVRVSLHVEAHKKNSPVVFDLPAKVEGGALKGLVSLKLSDKVRTLKTAAELKKEGRSYYAPALIFSVSAKGMTAESPEIPLISKATLYFQEAPGHAGQLENKKVTITTPDGKKVEKTIPKDGVILLEKTKPGKHVVAADGIQKLSYTAIKPPAGTAGPKDLTDEDKLKLVKVITLSEGGKGEAAYWAMNLDYEFEGRWDLPRGWYKKGKDGKRKAKPDKSDPNVPYSKYSDHPRHVGLSFGTIQFTQEGPLGEVVKAMQGKDSAKFKEIFGEHADDLVTTLTKKGDFIVADEEVFDNTGASMGKKKVKRRPSVQPVGGHDVWQSYWTDRFKKAGAHPAFQECQDEKAVSQYLDPCLKALGQAGRLQASQKCLALLYDRSVNNGVGRARKLVAGLAKSTDEKDYWKGVIAAMKASMKARMQHLFDSDQVSWELIYKIPAAKSKAG